MPVNKRYPLAELLAACRRYPLEPRRRITFEYVLLSGVNDSEEDASGSGHAEGHPDARSISSLSMPALDPFERPDERAVRRFQKVLVERHVTAPVRESGQDISAACGQLRNGRRTNGCRCLRSPTILSNGRMNRPFAPCSAGQFVRGAGKVVYVYSAGFGSPRSGDRPSGWLAM